jgi:hypothetical protein
MKTSTSMVISKNTEVGGYILHRKCDCGGKWYPTIEKAEAALARRLAKKDFKEMEKNAASARFLEKHKEFLRKYQR